MHALNPDVNRSKVTCTIGGSKLRRRYPRAKPVELQDSSSRVTLSDSEGSEICSISLDALRAITHSPTGKARGTLTTWFIGDDYSIIACIS